MNKCDAYCEYYMYDTSHTLFFILLLGESGTSLRWLTIRCICSSCIFGVSNLCNLSYFTTTLLAHMACLILVSWSHTLLTTEDCAAQVSSLLWIWNILLAHLLHSGEAIVRVVTLIAEFLAVQKVCPIVGMEIIMISYFYY